MLFAFRKGCQYAPNAVRGGLALYREVYNPRGCFGVTRFTSPRYVCERCHLGIPEKPTYGDPKGRNGRLFVPTTGEQDPRVARRRVHVERVLWPDAPRNPPRENPEPE